MDLFRRGELGLLGGGEGLRDDVAVSGISWSANRLPEDVYPASGLALAAAYHDIKTRLACLERENSSIKRKLKHYEVKVDRSALCQIYMYFSDSGQCYASILTVWLWVPQIWNISCIYIFLIFFQGKLQIYTIC